MQKNFTQPCPFVPNKKCNYEYPCKGCENFSDKAKVTVSLVLISKTELIDLANELCKFSHGLNPENDTKIITSIEQKLRQLGNL